MRMVSCAGCGRKTDDTTAPAQGWAPSYYDDTQAGGPEVDHPVCPDCFTRPGWGWDHDAQAPVWRGVGVPDGWEADVPTVVEAGREE